MKKSISVLVIVATILVIFSACGNSNKKYVGKWTWEGQSEGEHFYLTLNEDGTGSYNDYYQLTYTLTWTADGDKLTCNLTTVTGATSVAEFSYGEDDSGEYLTVDSHNRFVGETLYKES